MCLFLLFVPSAAPSVSSDQQEEVELVAMVRRMVAERFSSNPAYQLLKARFLSCFTVPALLATVQPIAEKPVDCQASEEDEEEEEEQLRKMKERGKQRRAEVSPEFIKGTFLFFYYCCHVSCDLQDLQYHHQPPGLFKNKSLLIQSVRSIRQMFKL